MLQLGRRHFVPAVVLAFAAAVAHGAHEAPGTDGAGELRFIKTWGAIGTGPGEFNFPIAIAIDASDRVYISDHYNSRVQIFDLEGNYRGEFKTLPSPGGLALDTSGRAYVAHFPASKKQMERFGPGNCISVYAPDGTLETKWGTTGAGDGEFDCPGGLAVDAEGRVYVADQTNHRVQVFDAGGRFLAKWGAYGNCEGEFGGMSHMNSRTGGPQFVAVGADGHIWTTEGANGRIQAFTRDGKFLRAWGGNENQAGGFGGTFAGFKNISTTLEGPVALCFDMKGRLWVSAVSGRIQCFDTEGRYLGGGGSQGEGPGQFFAAHGIAVDRHGRVFVVDAFNHRIQKFSPNF